MMAFEGHVTSHVIRVFILVLAVATSWATGPPMPFQEFGSVTRRDPFVFEGDTLVLDCNITNPDIRENSSLMYFDRSTDVYTGPIPAEYTNVLTTRAIRLRLAGMELADQGTYTCKQRPPHHGGGYRVRVIGHQFVTVDHRLKAVENISCVVYNWQRMTCTWDLGLQYQNPENVNVSLVWTIFGNQADCPHLTKTSCTWGPDQYQHGHVYKLLVDLKYVFNDKVKDTVKSKVKDIQTKLLIKPDPVIDLRATEVNSTCIQLRWDHNQAEERRNELYFIAQYKSQWSSTWTDMPTVIGEFTTRVCHLVPSTQYVFIMYVLPPIEYNEEDTAQGYSSLATNITVMTKEDVPGSEPSLCAGCFYCRDSKLCESATIYWKALPESLRHGTISKYKFALRNQTQELSVQVRRGVGLYSTTLELPPKVPLVEVRITAGTNMGFALRSSAIIIPRADMRPSPPSQFLVQTVEGKDKLFYLTWPASPLLEVGLTSDKEEKKDNEVTDTYKEDEQEEKMTGITIVWCVGSRMAFDCESDVHWERLAPERVTYELDLRNTEAHKERILIGIIREVKRAGQVLSSGIYWADCVYLADHKPSGPPKNVRFPKEQSPSQLYVMWDRMDCILEKAYITEYQVLYCLSNESGCTGIVRKKNVSSQLGEAVIQNLQPGKTYKVKVRAVSSAGYGQYSSPLAREVAVPRKDNGHEQSKQIVIAVVVAVVVLFLVITIAFLFWRCQRRKKKLEMDDDIQPYAETSNHGSSENRLLFRRSETSSDDNGSVHSHHLLINGYDKSTNDKVPPKSQVPLLSFQGYDKNPSHYDDIVDMRKPVANGGPKHWKGNSFESPTKTLGNISEEKDSGTEVRSPDDPIKSLSGPRSSNIESSSGGTVEYHKVTEDGDVSSENSHTPAARKDPSFPKTSLKQPNDMFVFRVQAEMSKPKMALSSKSPERSRDSAGGATGPSLGGSDYCPRDTSEHERPVTPVWQPRDSLALNDDDSLNMSTVCEAPTLERGRDGLWKGLVPIDEHGEIKCVVSDSQGERQKLRGYMYPGDSAIGANCAHEGQNDLSPLHELKETSLGAQCSHNIPCNIEAPPSPCDDPSLSRDQSSYPTHSPAHLLHKEGRSQKNGYVPRPDCPVADETDGQSGPTNDRISNEAEPEYLEPIQAPSRNKPFSHSFSHQPTTSTPKSKKNFQRSASVDLPHHHQPPSPIVNGYTTDTPPPYHAPPPPNRALRNPRLASLAVAPNSVSRPLSGVLLNLPSHFYQDPETTNDSSRMSTEL